MAVGNVELVPLLPVKGIKIGISEAYVRYPNRKDLTIFDIAEGANTAVVTTQNQFCARARATRARVCNKSQPTLSPSSAQAMPMLPQEDGEQRAYATCQALADKTRINVEGVLPYSTGVIGEALPTDKSSQTG